MMKKTNIIVLGVAWLVATALFVGCSDQFLKDKQDYKNTTIVIYDSYEGARSRVDDIYSLLLPSSTSSVTYDLPSAGSSDDNSTSTEEYGGLSIYVSDNVLTNSTVPDYFYSEAKTSRSPYGRIRSCNDIIAGIELGSIPADQKKELLGQVYFFRAWVYYRLVQTYGGVPIVDYVQEPSVSVGADLVIPRSTTKECIEFICNDLQKAATFLPFNWAGSNYGRVTAGTALALQGRVRLLYASPLFNRSDDTERWKLAYQSNKNALDTLSQGGFGLAYQEAPGINASGWAKMFSDVASPEAVFVTLYNNLKSAASTTPNKNNGWENSIRPTNTFGGGGKSTTAQMVDLFPLADGKLAVDKNGNPINGYNPKLFLLNRDPRFYRTFAFPGVRWAFTGDPTLKNPSDTLKNPPYPYNGVDYVLWNYSWYDNTAKQTDEEQSGYAADGLATNYKGIYIRKRTDDLDVNKVPLYIYDVDNQNPFAWNAAPYMEMRYAEVVLNFAESACGAGNYSEAYEALKLIRKRVGYISTNNYGLDADIVNDRAKLFAAILHERQIEFAYEGKRFDDMRRWMLWDGGIGQAGINPTWVLTGFGSNTCTYLDVRPLNGTRRAGIEVRVSNATPGGGIAPANNNSDPIKTNSITRPKAWDLREDISSQGDGLETFYRNYMERKQKQMDAKDKVISFRPEYYFIGLRVSAQSNNVTLLQTIGWTDAQRGSMGTFDPLAE